MSEITLTIIKVLYLALLWLFILSAVSVIRSDLFGRTVSTPEQQRPLEEPAPPKKGKRRRGAPHRIVISQGSQAGQSASLDTGTVMIGRGADCQIILDDDYVSTRHARIAASGDQWFVEDLGSTNGTFVGSVRITQPTMITLADTVRIGKTIMKLEP